MQEIEGTFHFVLMYPVFQNFREKKLSLIIVKDFLFQTYYFVVKMCYCHSLFLTLTIIIHKIKTKFNILSK